VTEKSDQPVPDQRQAEVADQLHAQAADERLDAASQVEELTAQLAEAQDKYLRAKAELENVRKRLYREMDDELRYANMALVRDLLPVMDNLQRAVQAAQPSPAAGLEIPADADVLTQMLHGVQMVAQQFEQVLARYNCRRIEALGEPFDPLRHEAISHLPSADHPPGTVMIEATTGYQLHDRIVRPSQVVVSSGPGEAKPS
jgi:molecular chaperone GrpE